MEAVTLQALHSLMAVAQRQSLAPTFRSSAAISVQPRLGCARRLQARRILIPSRPCPEIRAGDVFAPHPHDSTDHLTVGDCMTTRLFTAKPETTIEQALECLVENRITGLPVVDDDGKLVGVVSDYDLLAIDEVLGPAASGPAASGLFPEAGSSWKTFRELQKLLLKTKGKVVGDVMTPHPLTVRESTNLDQAARLLLGSKYRRLPVLDSQGRLVGLLTRGNVVKAALAMKQAADAATAEAATAPP